VSQQRLGTFSRLVMNRPLRGVSALAHPPASDRARRRSNGDRIVRWHDSMVLEVVNPYPGKPARDPAFVRLGARFDEALDYVATANQIRQAARGNGTYRAVRQLSPKPKATNPAC
jgi:hypothetical protein